MEEIRRQHPNPYAWLYVPLKPPSPLRLCRLICLSDTGVQLEPFGLATRRVTHGAD